MATHALTEVNKPKGLSQSPCPTATLAISAGPLGVCRKWPGLPTPTPNHPYDMHCGLGEGPGLTADSEAKLRSLDFPCLLLAMVVAMLLPVPGADRWLSLEWKEPASEGADGRTSGSQVLEPRC